MQQQQRSLSLTAPEMLDVPPLLSLLYDPTYLPLFCLFCIALLLYCSQTDNTYTDIRLLTAFIIHALTRRFVFNEVAFFDRSSLLSKSAGSYDIEIIAKRAFRGEICRNLADLSRKTSAF